MKKAMFFKFSLLFLSAQCLTHSFAQGAPQWGLPEWAKARLGKGSINDIRYSPDGTRLAVATSIGVWLYDTAAYQEAAVLTGHSAGVGTVAFSPDGSTIASGSSDGTVLLWTLASSNAFGVEPLASGKTIDDTEKHQTDSIATELSEPVQPRNLDTVSVWKRCTCDLEHL